MKVPSKPMTFLVVQSDGDGLFMVADEFERAVVIDSFVNEGFTCTLYDVALAVPSPSDSYLIGPHAIKSCNVRLMARR
jgi:hypothetical protein